MVVSWGIKSPLIFWDKRDWCTMKTHCNFQNTKLEEYLLKLACQYNLKFRNGLFMSGELNWFWQTLRKLHCWVVRSLMSLFHTAILENTRKICPVICPGMVWFWFIHTASDFPGNLCVHSHTTRKDPIKTRDISCDVYNAARTIWLNWRTISASAQIVRSSLIAASFQFTHFSSWTLICLQNNR